METDVSVLLCSSKCCPCLGLTDDGQTGAITADRNKDEVYVDENNVSIRFTREQLQILADELANNGILPTAYYQYQIPPKDDVGSTDYTTKTSDNTKTEDGGNGE